MNDFGRRLLLDAPFDVVLGETCRALREEGLQVIARVDVRDRLWRDLRHNFRPCMRLEAWAPEPALRAAEEDVDAVIALPSTVLVYEAADGRTAVLAEEPLAPMIADPEWRRERPVLRAIADDEAARIARVLGRVQHAVEHGPSTRPADDRHEPCAPAA
jgi:uncharacterized protein (DUF302 family)